jgi:hypothetical protein
MVKEHYVNYKQIAYAKQTTVGCNTTMYSNANFTILFTDKPNVWSFSFHSCNIYFLPIKIVPGPQRNEECIRNLDDHFVSS